LNWDAHSFAKQQHSNTRAPKIRFGLTGCSQPFSSNILGFDFLRLSRMLRLVSTVFKWCKLCGQRRTLRTHQEFLVASRDGEPSARLDSQG
jgi:hypothetical protein